MQGSIATDEMSKQRGKRRDSLIIPRQLERYAL
jgi:hypothetical protein